MPAAAPDAAPTSEAPPSWRLTLWRILDDPSSGPVAKVWSIFMMFVILGSILFFTLSSIPAGLIRIDIWTNHSSGEIIPFSTGGDFKGLPDDDTYRTDSDSVRQSSDELDDKRAVYRELEIFCISVFTLEYVLRLLTASAGPGLGPFLKSGPNTVDLVSILPFYLELAMSAMASGDSADLSVLQILRLIRLTRVTRIFKMSNNFQGLIVLFKALTRSLSALLMLFFFMGIFSVLFATLIFFVEDGKYDPYRMQWVREDGSPSPFESIPASLWWTIITMTTVGYGDHFPVSNLGQLVAVVTMIVALIVLSLPITIIGANFDEEYNEMRRQKAEEKADEAKRAAEAKRMEAKMGEGEGAPQEGAAGLPQDEALKRSASSRRRSADPVKEIQALIMQAHADVLRDVERLMREQETELRTRIQAILQQCTETGVDAAE